MKVVIVGSCKHAPYLIIQAPNPFDFKLYNEDHEKAYEKACEIYYPKIREADEIWIYAPNGIGEHTKKDIEYAKSQRKKILILVPFDIKCMHAEQEIFDIFATMQDRFKNVEKLQPITLIDALAFTNMAHGYVQTVLGDLHHAWCAEAQKTLEELLKTFPPRSCTNHASLLLFYKEAVEWFEKAEKLLEAKE